jgi:hypothetical protein
LTLKKLRLPCQIKCANFSHILQIVFTYCVRSRSEVLKLHQDSMIGFAYVPMFSAKSADSYECIHLHVDAVLLLKSRLLKLLPDRCLNEVACRTMMQ